MTRFCAAFARNSSKSLIVALGANRRGAWGKPQDTFELARSRLIQAGLRLERSSRIYATAPMGPGRQPLYLNAVLLMRGDMAPAALLRLLKRLERNAGRRLGSHWGPRSLDLDVLCHGRKQLGWPPPRRRERGRLILPHPEMHRRAFMLVPLLEIVPHWRHPALGVTGRVLLARLGRRETRKVVPALAFASSACDKNAT